MASSTLSASLFAKGSQGPQGDPGGGGGSIGGTTGTVADRILRADGTGGATVQSSPVSLDGSGNLTGVGNITLTGTVDGVDVSALAASLGTAATTAATDYQPSDAELTAIAGLTSAADQVPYFTGSGTASVYTATQSGRALSGLSWAAGTQVPSLTAAGTAGLLTVGTGAGNLVVLNSGGDLPALDMALTDTWSAFDYVADRDGRANGVGWTETGGTHTYEASPIPKHKITTVSAIETYISRSLSGVISTTDEWELQVEMLVSGTVSSYQNSIRVDDGTKRMQFTFASTGISEYNGGLYLDEPGCAGCWVTVTIRKTGNNTAPADSMLTAWIGPMNLGRKRYAGCAASAATEIRIGKLTTTSTTESGIRQAKMNVITAGNWNSSPDRLFAHTGRGR